MKKIKVLMFGAVLLGVVACSGKVTSENLARIETGMTRAQVEQILGKPSKEESSSTLGMTGSTMTYKKGGAEVKIILLNDKVVSKSGSFK